MARGGRRQGSAGAGAKAVAASPNQGKNRGRRPPGGPTERDIARSIQTSACRVHVLLQLQDVKRDGVTLSSAVNGFAGALGCAPSAVMAQDGAVDVELLECGLNDWENLVELQRVLAGTRRPHERGEDGEEKELFLAGRASPRHDAKTDEWRFALSFVRMSQDKLWEFATALMLRLRSVGVFSRVLLPTLAMRVPLVASIVEWDQGVGDLEQFDWEGCLSWNSVTVIAASIGHSTELQRVFLPPMTSLTSLQSLSSSGSVPNLRHPALLGLVDGMLSTNVDERKPIAIILRGIPGSGKSTLRREIAEICRHRGVVFSVCSADFFFETPRGYVFDVKKLGPAHDKCKSEFTKAILSGGSRRAGGKGRKHHPKHHIVVVDNTNTQRWEYETYETIAREHGCSSYILEMVCPDALTAFRMGQRNSHGVPPGKVVSMFLRWELDQRAQCFSPQFEHSQLTANPLSDGHVGGVTYLGLFLDKDARQALLTKIPVAHPNVLADHVTLFYRPNKQYLRDVELGESFTITAVEIVQDERGQTLRVELDERLLLQTRNKISHITISTVDGVNASYSNELLESDTATRTRVDPPIEIKVQVGAALLVDRQRTITTTSPFGVEVQSCAVKGTPSQETERSFGAPSTKVFILYVEEKDIVETGDVDQERYDQANVKLLLQTQLQHRMGPACCTHRLLCVQRSGDCSSLSRAELLSGMQRRFQLTPLHQVELDELLVIPESQAYQGFQDALAQRLGGADGVNVCQLSMLTTSSEPLQWPLREVEKLQKAALSVTRIGYESGVLTTTAGLAPPCSTIESMLDLLGINVQERMRSLVQHGMRVVGDAWGNVLQMGPATRVHRVDTTLLSLDSDVVELCLLLPPSTDSSVVAALQQKLMKAIQLQGVVWDSADSTRLGGFYFRLRSLASYTPVFYVHMVNQSAASISAKDSLIMAQLEFCEAQQRQVRETYEVEVYAMLTALLRGSLRQRFNALPSECRLSSWVNLLSERLTWIYLQHVALPDVTDARPTMDDVASGRIIFTLYRMLGFLSKWEEDDWATALTPHLRKLLGDDASQLAWQRLMSEVVHECVAVVTAFELISDESLVAPSSRPADHLQVLVSLLRQEDQQSSSRNADEDEMVTPGLVHAYVEFPDSSKPSTLRCHVLCDALRSAAAAVASQDQTTTVSEARLFRCEPSQLTRRVDMTAPSMEMLHSVVERFKAAEALRGSQEIHDDSVFSAGCLKLRLAANDEEVVLD